MNRRYVITDVFTDRPFAGNPLAVVLDAEGLDTVAMQAIATEFNLSETTFVLPPEDPAHAATVRIFTPAREVPFAGHPTIGTALVLAEHGRGGGDGDELTMVLEERAGPVPVRLRRQDGRWQHAEFRAPGKPAFAPAPPRALVADAVGLALDDLVTGRGLPEGASHGLPFLVVEVRDRGALARAQLERATWSEHFRGTVHDHLYLATADAPAGFDFQVRMFAPGAGIEEDPATGSATAAFGAWLGERAGLADGRHRFVLAQGVEMGRPSRLEVTVEREAGALAAVLVGGGAVTVMEGTLLASPGR